MILDDRPITRQSCHQVAEDGTVVFRARVGPMSYQGVVTVHGVHAKAISAALQVVYHTELRRMGKWTDRRMDNLHSNVYHSLELVDGKLLARVFNYGGGQFGQTFDEPGSRALWQAHCDLVRELPEATALNTTLPVEVQPIPAFKA